MPKFEVEIGALVTIYCQDNYIIEAENEEIAINQAKDIFYDEKRADGADFDMTDVRLNNIEQL